MLKPTKKPHTKNVIRKNYNTHSDLLFQLVSAP